MIDVQQTVNVLSDLGLKVMKIMISIVLRSLRIFGIQ
jgi:hypothetical protein